jgi:hypothetical protein
VSAGGIVCGHLALSKFNQQPQLQGRGLAIAGLVLGYFGAVCWVLYLLFFGGMSVLEGLTHR